VGASVSRACAAWSIDVDPDDRQHAHQGAPLGLGRKRGEQKQAIGRSRGGRNTKIHALADAKGRLLSLLLSGGQAHDCPPAQRLIRRTKPAKKLLGDTAYDSAELRQWLQDRGTKPVVPNRSNRKKPFSFDSKAYKQRHLIENAFGRPRTSDVSSPDTTSWPETSSPPPASLLLSYGGFNESRP